VKTSNLTLEVILGEKIGEYLRGEDDLVTPTPFRSASRLQSLSRLHGERKQLAPSGFETEFSVLQPLAMLLCLQS
jgi:hypothetical protein